tara:strand:+ start:806 stop:1177 length:372 start_codon:yes stop_codon:yes gene_type:complete
MKKILTIIFILIPFHSLSIEKTTTFTLEKFNQAQEDGKTVVINSWNKSCFTCAKQIKILDQAKEKFKNVVFLSFEQNKDKNIAKLLNIDYWTTITVYKNQKEIAREMGLTNKDEIYNLIKKGT